MQRTQIARRKSHGNLKNRYPRERAILNMYIQRCQNRDNPEFKNYGDRGIRVCDRWLGSDGFLNFMADVGPQPFDGAGLRRLNQDGDFEPGNVEWGSTRGNILTFEGKSMSVAAWARELGVKPNTLRARLRSGWAVEDVLTRDVAPRFYWSRAFN